MKKPYTRLARILDYFYLILATAGVFVASVVIWGNGRTPSGVEHVLYVLICGATGGLWMDHILAIKDRKDQS